MIDKASLMEQSLTKIIVIKTFQNVLNSIFKRDQDRGQEAQSLKFLKNKICRIKEKVLIP